MKAISAVVVVLGWVVGMHEVRAFDNPFERGMYVSYAAGCATCHTRSEFLAGGRPISTPVGIFYTPNITPDRKYGLGSWTEENFVRAMREGIGAKGEYLYPACPYPSFSSMTEDDRSDLWVYLNSQYPVAKENQVHVLPWFLSSRKLLATWQRSWFEPGRFIDDPSRSKQWNRGAYLVEVLGHCGECHTPRGSLGRPDQHYYLAGAHKGTEGLVIPNITPDWRTGIGRWSGAELEEFLYTGERPDGTLARSLMQEVLRTSIMHLVAEDRRAIAAYLRSLPPMYHNPHLMVDPFEEDDHFQ